MISIIKVTADDYILLIKKREVWFCASASWSVSYACPVFVSGYFVSVQLLLV